ncbi:MAG: tetratricopeptide repeat protein [Elainellaceae cyanobacterium]
MPRSVRVHPDHQPALALALERNGFLTQGDLAAHLEIALSTVSNFFRGLNVSVSKFEQICEALGLDRKSIIIPSGSVPSSPKVDSPALEPDFFAYDDAWVGRESLIEDLKQRITGSCRILLISGIAGIGKTAIADKRADNSAKADLHDKLAYLYLHQQNYNQAIDHYLQAFGVAQAQQNLQLQGKVLNNLGSIFLGLEQYSEAIGYFQYAINVWQQLGDKEKQAKLWFLLGKTFKEQNRIEQAIAAFRSVKDLYNQLHKPDLVQRCDAVIESLSAGR